jgi:hypothetical protein
LYGIKLSFLVSYFAQYNIKEPFTVDHVKLLFVKPGTEHRSKNGFYVGESFAEFLLRDEKLAENVKDVADVFVGYSRDHMWTDFVSALSVLPANPYVWVDILSINIHQLPTESKPLWWYAAIGEVIRKIGKTRLVLDNWRNPSLEKVDSSLWEFLVSVESGVETSLLFSPITTNSFIEMLRNGAMHSDSFYGSFSHINLSFGKDESVSRYLHRDEQKIITMPVDMVNMVLSTSIKRSLADLASSMVVSQDQSIEASHILFGCACLNLSVVSVNFSGTSSSD